MSPHRLLAPALACAAALCAAASLATPALAAPPSAAALLAGSSAALTKAASFHVDLEAHATAKADGTVTAAQLRKLALPLDVTAHGDLSRRAIVVSGKLTVGDRTLTGELRASGKELYVDFMGSWYGAKGAASGNGLTLDTDPKDLTSAVSALLVSGISATVKDGPTLDGIDTWEVDGTVSGPALAKLAQQAGASISPAQARRLAAKAEVALFIGKGDSLPRRVKLDETLGGADLASARAGAGGLVPLPTAAKGVRSVTLSLVVDLSRFGEAVAFVRPTGYKPLESLLSALLGGLLGPGSPGFGKGRTS